MKLYKKAKLLVLLCFAMAVVLLSMWYSFSTLERRRKANSELVHAVETHAVQEAKMALSRGADPNINRIVKTEEEPQRNIWNFFDRNSSEEEFEPVLIYSIRKRNISMSQCLLAAGASVEKSDNHRNTPLIAATMIDSPEIVRLLISHGADINGRGFDNWTALSWSAYKGNSDIVDTLIKHGADVDSSSLEGFTALMAAAERGDPRCTQLLLKAKVEINKVTNDGATTALSRAKSRRHSQVVRLLLRHGAKS